MRKEYVNRWNAALVNPPVTHAEYEASISPVYKIEVFQKQSGMLVSQYHVTKDTMNEVLTNLVESEPMGQVVTFKQLVKYTGTKRVVLQNIAC